jgi:hypothetical protein
MRHIDRLRRCAGIPTSPRRVRLSGHTASSRTTARRSCAPGPTACANSCWRAGACRRRPSRFRTDPGVTNIRNTASPHWRRWLGPEHRCLVPMTSFSEKDKDADGKATPAWFALADDRPLAFFAGIWTILDKRQEREGRRGHGRPLRLPDDGTEARGRRRASQSDAGGPGGVRRSRGKARRALAKAKALQRAPPDGVLTVVARGERGDGAAAA